MAKDTKGAAKEQQNVSADNVVEKLMKGNLVTDIADKAAEEIRQDEEKRKISEGKDHSRHSEEAYRIVGPSSG